MLFSLYVNDEVHDSEPKGILQALSVEDYGLII